MLFFICFGSTSTCCTLAIRPLYLLVCITVAGESCVCVPRAVEQKGVPLLSLYYTCTKYLSLFQPAEMRSGTMNPPFVLFAFSSGFQRTRMIHCSCSSVADGADFFFIRRIYRPFKRGSAPLRCRIRLCVCVCVFFCLLHHRPDDSDNYDDGVYDSDDGDGDGWGSEGHWNGGEISSG